MALTYIVSCPSSIHLDVPKSINPSVIVLNISSDLICLMPYGVPTSSKASGSPELPKPTVTE